MSDWPNKICFCGTTNFLGSRNVTPKQRDSRHKLQKWHAPKKNVWMSDKSWEPWMHECFNVLNNFCFHVYAQKSLSHSLTVSFTHSWHAQQLLFLCLCSKVTLSLSLSHCLIHSLSTCSTTFVFMSMLKSHCFLPKIAMVFFWHPHHHPILWV